MSSLAGTFLVARAPLRDGFFARTVILLLEHDENKTLGVILNRLAETEGLPFPIFVGGPCKLEGLLMIHGRPDWVDHDDKMEICPGVYLGTKEQFEMAAETEQAENERFRVFTGYAGWGPQQLESEMEEGAWIVLPANGDILFDTPVQDLWQRLAPSTIPKPSMN